MRPTRPHGPFLCYLDGFTAVAAVVVVDFASVFLTAFFVFLAFLVFFAFFAAVFAAPVVPEAAETVFEAGAVSAFTAIAIETENINAIKITITFFILALH
jgi:hypothetical protein